ncbi:hypothetical protein M378DRAFT_171079 [Amanita muscaria Koide BX008]|uniref:Uncharacterized protein n=1 Tax=Amanita muscaria (strain Koide BX008) TaxID=946122 RepID=A0A0C2WP79_AMAMK|nr:hypothetical protein M378DRAFT_171079 [Amanita muscaria Koide BX008]
MSVARFVSLDDINNNLRSLPLTLRQLRARNVISQLFESELMGKVYRQGEPKQPHKLKKFFSEHVMLRKIDAPSVKRIVEDKLGGEGSRGARRASFYLPSQPSETLESSRKRSAYGHAETLSVIRGNNIFLPRIQLRSALARPKN